MMVYTKLMLLKCSVMMVQCSLMMVKCSSMMVKWVNSYTHFTIINENFTSISLKYTIIRSSDHHWKAAPTDLMVPCFMMSDIASRVQRRDFFHIYTFHLLCALFWAKVWYSMFKLSYNFIIMPIHNSKTFITFNPKNCFSYSPFHKILPRSSLQMHLISVRFYELVDA